MILSEVKVYDFNSKCQLSKISRNLESHSLILNIITLLIIILLLRNQTL